MAIPFDLDGGRLRGLRLGFRALIQTGLHAGGSQTCEAARHFAAIDSGIIDTQRITYSMVADCLHHYSIAYFK